jgi:hypothetical protein
MKSLFWGSPSGPQVKEKSVHAKGGNWREAASEMTLSKKSTPPPTPVPIFSAVKWEDHDEDIRSRVEGILGSASGRFSDDEKGIFAEACKRLRSELELLDASISLKRKDVIEADAACSKFVLNFFERNSATLDTIEGRTLQLAERCSIMKNTFRESRILSLRNSQMEAERLERELVLIDEKRSVLDAESQALKQKIEAAHRRCKSFESSENSVL